MIAAFRNMRLISRWVTNYWIKVLLIIIVRYERSNWSGWAKNGSTVAVSKFDFCPSCEAFSSVKSVVRFRIKTFRIVVGS